MGELRCVTLESAEWIYSASPLDYYYAPRLVVRGHVTDGFRVKPFSTVLYP